MKAKIFTFFVLAAFLVLSISLVSATISFTAVPTLSKTATSVDIKIQSTENETVSFTGLDAIEDDSGNQITFSLPADVVLTADTEETVTIDYIIDSGFDFDFGETYDALLTASGTVSTEDKSTILSFGESSYCEDVENKGDLKVSIKDITATGFSDNDDEWYAGDEIEIEVEVENNGDEDVENVEVSWCLYDTDNNECVLDDEESDFDLDEDEEETVTITFTIDPDDLENDVTDYKFFAKATGEIAKGTYEGDDTCDSDSEDIDMIIGDDFVVLTDLEITETVTCGGEVVVSADVWNIGEDDQDDVAIEIENRELGISETIEVGDIDSFEDESFTQAFVLASDLEEGSYKLIISVVDDDGDIYESEDDEESVFSKIITVSGCGPAPSEEKARVSATLESGGKAGDELVVKATVTNTGEETETFTVSATGFSDWSEAPLIEPSVTILSEGESKEVTLTFNVNRDVSGDQTFNIVATPSDGDATSQLVAVTIEARSGMGITGFAINSDNWYLWGIGALNVILVLIIIIVAIRVARS